VNDFGPCDECFAKLERDLIRTRDWDYSTTAFMTPPDQLEDLCERVIQDWGADYELIAAPKTVTKPKQKNKRSHSRETQRKREIAARAVRDYSTEDILQAARNFLRVQNEEWVKPCHAAPLRDLLQTQTETAGAARQEVQESAQVSRGLPRRL
jgi:hypothetical protein